MQTVGLLLALSSFLYAGISGVFLLGMIAKNSPNPNESQLFIRSLVGFLLGVLLVVVSLIAE